MKYQNILRPVTAYQSNQAPEEDQSGDANSSSHDNLMTETGSYADATVNQSIIPAEIGTSALAVEDDDYYYTSEWPRKVHDHLAAIFSDGFNIGEVLEILDDETVQVSYMAPKKIMTADAMDHPQRFLIWPSKRDVYNTNRNSIIHLRPYLELEYPPSTKRNFIFSCLNAELLEAMAASVIEENSD